MNKKRKTILGILIFIAFMAISYLVYSALSNNFKPSQDIKLSDISSQIQGLPTISSQIEEKLAVSSQIQGLPTASSQIQGLPNVSSQMQKISAASSQVEKKSATSSQAVRTPAVSSQIEKRETPPDFTVFNSKGNKVKLSDFAGKPIVLNFWASWCPPCKEEMPSFNRQYAKVKGDVIFIMVDLVDGQRETQAKGQKYYDSQGYGFPIYFDNEQQAANAYSISSIPVTIFINSYGKIVETHRGSITEQDLAAAIELIK